MPSKKKNSIKKSDPDIVPFTNQAVKGDKTKMIHLDLDLTLNLNLIV